MGGTPPWNSKTPETHRKAIHEQSFTQLLRTRVFWSNFGLPGTPPGSILGRPGTREDHFLDAWGASGVNLEPPGGPRRPIFGCPGRLRDRFWAARGPPETYSSRPGITFLEVRSRMVPAAFPFARNNAETA